MSTPKIQIKPCPFCGGEAKYTIFMVHLGNRKVWTCQCANHATEMCPANSITYGATRRIAIERWNRRNLHPNLTLDGHKMCPFCGGHKVEIKHHPIDLPDIEKPFVSICCENEQCESRPLITGDTELEAIYHWNQRAE